MLVLSEFPHSCQRIKIKNQDEGKNAVQDTVRESVQKSILEAIQQGDWDYEPAELPSQNFDSTGALPGSDEKLAMLASRAQRGLPLWHDGDCRDYDDKLDA